MDRLIKPLSMLRILIIGLVAVIAVLGMAITILVIGHAGSQDLGEVEVLASSSSNSEGFKAMTSASSSTWTIVS